MANPDHYAIVIGLSSYPRLGDPPPANLKGPELDARAIAEWLTDEKGGGLPVQNVKVICSTDHGSPPLPSPTRDQLEEAFVWLDELAAANLAKGQRRSVGTRIYFYVSGHGFSPKPRQACLLAGNAAEKRYSANIYPSAWIEWLQDAAYFREFVLWMDCCMDRMLLVQPNPPPLDPLGAGTAPAGTFLAFAAPRSHKAIEKPFPPGGNEWHGVFTWTLLDGLRGAAANPDGLVTADSLADWLRESQLAWLDGKERISPDIATEPDIFHDGGLTFARDVAPKEFDVVLRFPAAAANSAVRLWSGSPAQPTHTFPAAAAGTPLRLKPGLYLAEVKDAGIRHGFAVTRPETFDLTLSGDVPTATAGSFQLTVEPAEPTADVRVVAADFHKVDGNSGRLSSKLPFGLYEIRVRVGRQTTQQVVLLDGPFPKPAAGAGASADVMPRLPEITSAAPLSGTRAIHEYHMAARADAATRIDVQAGAGAQLMVMTRRYGDADGVPPAATLPWQGVAVVDSSGKVIADLSRDGQRNAGKDPVSACSIALAPGAYVLQYPYGPDGKAAQSLIVPGGWRLEAYLMYVANAGDAAERPGVSLFMRRIGAGPQTQADLQLEKARVALADERAVLGDELSMLLLEKFENPLSGIVGGHLLLIEHEHNPQRSLAALNTVVANLRGLVGDNHPDVEALSLACPDPGLRTKRPLAAAPIFERSWRLFVKASHDDEKLVPLARWQEVQASLSTPPFLSWATEKSVQREFRRALRDVAFGLPPAVGASPGTDVLESFQPKGPVLRGGRVRGAPPSGTPSGTRTLRQPPRSLPQPMPPTVSPARARALDLPAAAYAALAEEYRSGDE